MRRRTNEEWLRALKQPGERQAQAMAELRDYLLRAALVYLRDHRTDLRGLAASELRELAEDFAQEALLLIRANLDSFRGDSKFTTWAYRFVVNYAASELRRRRYSNISLEYLIEQRAILPLEAVESAPGLDPELATEREDFVSQLLSVIRNELNERQRVAIVGVHIQGLSIQEVAELLDTTPNTLYKIIHDARRKIKARLLELHLSEGDIMALFESRW